MPFFHYPFFYNPNYYNRFKNYNRRPISITSYMPPNSKKETDAHQVDKNSHQDYKKNNSKSNTDNYFFELFGLKLYFDDILLICLIFFLYQEGVRDDELFISLILLLLS